MNKPISAGDLAIIINSTTGKSIGKIVTCISMDGEHPEYGRMWLVESGGPIMTAGGDTLRRAHSPEKWLRRIPNEPVFGEDALTNILEDVLEV